MPPPDARVALLSPAKLLGELEFGARRLDKIGADLGRAIVERDNLEQEVVRRTLLLRAKVYAELRKEARNEDRRSIPGEDVRDALLAERMADEDPELVGQTAELSGLKARIQALQEFRRSTSDGISARQSVLNGLKDEAQNAPSSNVPLPVDPDTGEVQDDEVPF